MIDVDNLRFSYPGVKQETLRGLTFSIAKGEIFGFLGPSGAGKSTTQKILIGLLKGYRGKARVMGSELRTLSPDYYERVGVAFESPNLYTKFTALENLSFFGSLYKHIRHKPEELLARVGLEEYATTRVANFSKGMRMRLNFCRALLHDPDVIFLDEPTSGLDPGNARIIKDIILEQKRQGKTIFLTTHNMGVADDLCDRVAFITDGQIALVDSPHQLKIRHGSKVVRVEYRDATGPQIEEFPLREIGTSPRFLSVIKEKEIVTLHTLEATLEDIFIAVTGRSLI